MKKSVSVFGVVSVVAMIALRAPALAQEGPCRPEIFEETPFIICEVDPESDDVRLFLANAGGEPHGQFAAVDAALAAQGERLVFAMNAGMYHRDRSPVGLYVENGRQIAPLILNDGPGNFHLKPNGVFLITGQGAAVLESAAYQARPPSGLLGMEVRYATQSGPMLVIDGALHPRFLEDSDSLKRRNGVGVRKDGAVVFAISDAPVNFHRFARLFRDDLDCPDALYFDGTISRLYAPDIGRAEPGLPMGPIVGVVARRDGAAAALN